MGLAQRWRDPVVRLLVLLAGSFVVVSLVSVAPPRLRAPFDLVCCIGVGLLVDRLWPAGEAGAAGLAVAADAEDVADEVQGPAQGMRDRASRQSGQTGNFWGSRLGIHFLPHRAVIS